MDEDIMRKVFAEIDAMGYDVEFLKGVKEHVRTNTRCNFCGRDFSTVSDLSTHLDVHM